MEKVIFTTTLNAIRAKHPCSEGWEKLLEYLGKTEADDEPINLLTILESNGVHDMLWALKCVKHPELDRVARLMACDFAEMVLPILEKKYPSDKRQRNAIEVARRYAAGMATDTELSGAWAAAKAAAADAVADAVWAAAWAAEADAAADAAWAAERSVAREAAEADAAADAARAVAREAAAADAQKKIINRYLAWGV